MPRILIVEADGGSRGNPGHAGYGALVRDPETGAILAEKARYLGKASNNVAEYSGLIAGLELADEIDPECWILAKMDSKLVVEQMSGRWKIKHEDMRSLAQRARAAVDPKRVKYEWIPRELNKDADRLSNEAMDAGMAGVDWQPAAAAVVESMAEPAAVVESMAEPAAESAPEARGRLHHLTFMVSDFESSVDSLGWLLERIGYVQTVHGQDNSRWAGADSELVLVAQPEPESAPRPAARHHLAFRAGSRAEVDLLARRAGSHGWIPVSDRQQTADQPAYYTARLRNGTGFEVELVAEA